MQLFQSLSLLKRDYIPLNIVTLSKQHLLANFHSLSSINTQVKIAPVLKSNAYGHGIVEVAKVFETMLRIYERERLGFFCVDSLFEAYKLYNAGIKTPILIMGFVSPENLKTKQLPFMYAVSSWEILKGIHFYQPKALFHIFVDTGMHREGVSVDELPILLKKTSQDNSIQIDGIMSHLAISNECTEQLSYFQKARSIMHEHNIKPTWEHIAASECLINTKHQKDIGNLARIGIALYGILPQLQHEVVKPVLQLQTTLVAIKQVKADEVIGYDFTFKADKKMTIGILPIGYNDGIDIRLSNKGSVLLRGKQCKIIGRVSMNITTIDISHVPNAQIGDSVIVYSNNHYEENSILQCSNSIGINPRELLIHINNTIRRQII